MYFSKHLNYWKLPTMPPSECLIRLCSLLGMAFPPLSYLTNIHLSFSTLRRQHLSGEPSDSLPPLCTSVLPIDVHLQTPLRPFIFFPTRRGTACGQVSIIRVYTLFKVTWYIGFGGTWVKVQTLRELFALGQVVCILSLDFLSSAYLPRCCEVSCEVPATAFGLL